MIRAVTAVTNTTVTILILTSILAAAVMKMVVDSSLKLYAISTNLSYLPVSNGGPFDLRSNAHDTAVKDDLLFVWIPPVWRTAALPEYPRMDQYHAQNMRMMNSERRSSTVRRGRYLQAQEILTGDIVSKCMSEPTIFLRRMAIGAAY